MSTYQLIFSNDAHGVAKKIEFEAEDAAEALTIAHSEAPNRNAELWQDDAMLCTIRRSVVGYWELSQAGEPDASSHELGDPALGAVEPRNPAVSDSSFG